MTDMSHAPPLTYFAPFTEGELPIVAQGEYEPADWRLLKRHAQAPLRKRMRTWIILSTVFGLPILGMVQSSLTWLRFICIWLEIVLLLLFAFGIGMAVCNVRSVWRYLLSEPWRYRFGERGFRNDGRMGTMSVAWQGCNAVRSSENVLLLSETDGRSWYVVPRRFFASDSDWQAACAWAKLRADGRQGNANSSAIS